MIVSFKERRPLLFRKSLEGFGFRVPLKGSIRVRIKGIYKGSIKGFRV